MTYRCPVCRAEDRMAYVICQHPGCPDGRDQRFSTSGHVANQPKLEPDEPTYRPGWPLFAVSAIGWIALIALTLMVLTGCQSSGPIIGPCTGACIGPYDLGLNSHREALQ